MERESKNPPLHSNIPAEIKDCLKGLNPQFSTHQSAYTENCQRCVVAYEVRRRGYSTIAKPYICGGTDPLPYMNLQYGWPAVFREQMLTNCSALTREQAQENIERQMRLFGNHSRAIVKVRWPHRAKGHLFMAENIEDVIYFVDPQTGDDDVSWYFQYIDPNYVAIMRTDCVRFTGLVRQCCE